jgi:hypothetical protein
MWCQRDCRVPDSSFFFRLFGVEIFAQVNKILEKLVEVKLVEAQVEMTRKILNLWTHLRRRISKICLFFVVKTQSKCEQKKRQQWHYLSI